MVAGRCFGHSQHGHDLIRAFARTDLLLHDGALKVLELNVDTGIGGMVGSSGIPQHYFDSPAGWDVCTQVPLYADSPLLATVRFLKSVARAAGLGPRPFIAVLEWDYHLEVQRGYAALLAQYGLPAAFVHADSLTERDGYLYVGERRIDIAIKNFSMGSLDYPENMGAITAAVEKGGTIILSDSRSVLCSNKRLLAVLSENAERLNGRDRALVERYVPWSREVKHQDVRFEGEVFAMRDLLSSAHRDHFVLKCGSGEGGLSVVIGRHASVQEWEAVVEKAFRTGDYVLQKYEAPDSLELPFLSEGGDCVIWRKHPYVLGQFVIDGQSGGLLVRFDTSRSEGVINFARGAGIVTGVIERTEETHG